MTNQEHIYGHGTGGDTMGMEGILATNHLIKMAKACRVLDLPVPAGKATCAKIVFEASVIHAQDHCTSADSEIGALHEVNEFSTLTVNRACYLAGQLLYKIVKDEAGENKARGN